MVLSLFHVSEKKQLASVWTREQEEELEELFHRYKDEEGTNDIHRT